MRLLRPLVFALLFSAFGAHAQQNLPSDYLKITLPGAVPFVYALVEGGAAAGLPETAVFNLPPLTNGPLSGLLPPGIAPVIAAVVFFEPAGTAVEPGSTPVFIDNRIVSDLVLGFSTPNGLFGPIGVAFISDGDANLAVWAGIVSGLPAPFLLTKLDEPMTPMDVTALLGSPPYTVEVWSDIEAVPEPGSVALWLGGLGALAWTLRRRIA